MNGKNTLAEIGPGWFLRRRVIGCLPAHSGFEVGTGFTTEKWLGFLHHLRKVSLVSAIPSAVMPTFVNVIRALVTDPF